MSQKVRDVVTKVLNVIEGTYPNWKKDERTVIVWHIALEQTSDQAIMKAIPLFLRGHKSGFAPTPAEFLEYCEDGSSADRAWYELLDAVSRYGYVTSPTFSHDPKIAESVRRLGGWVRLCRSTQNELSFVHRDFKAIYEGLYGDDYNPTLDGHGSARQVEYRPKHQALPPSPTKTLPQPDPIKERPVEDSRRVLMDLVKKMRTEVEKGLTTPDEVNYRESTLTEKYRQPSH